MAKRKIKYVIIILIICLSLIIGSSFAFVLNNNKGNNNKIITMNDINIEYIDGDSINSDGLQLPITKEEVLKYAPKYEFSVKNNYEKDIYLKFKITELILNEQTKQIYEDGNFRYIIYKNEEKICEGSFEGFDENKKEVILQTNIKQEKLSTISYKLYIYIRDNSMEQNHFLNQNITGKIKVEGYDKALPTLAYKILGEDNEYVSDGTPTLGKNAISQETYDTLSESDKSYSVVETGIYKAIDNDGETYYFRGHIKNNYVKFADMLWKIIRINGDGSIRIISDSSIGNSQFNYYDSEETYDFKYTGYTYDNSSPNVQDGTPSKLKIYLENWYSDNLKDKYDRYIVTSSYCNDTNTEYPAIKRMETSNATLICPKTDQTYGGEYNLKIGLLNVDEVVYIGHKMFKFNPDSFLAIPKAYYFLMTPSNKDAKHNIFYYHESGGFFPYSNINQKTQIVPVINLNFNLIVLEGDGTKSNPYILKTSN